MTDDHPAAEHPVEELPGMLAGELPPGRDAAIGAHLAGCDPCRRELAVLAQVTSWLQDAARMPFVGAAELPPLRIIPAALGGRRPSRRRLAVAAAGVAAVIAGGVFTGLRVADSGGAAPGPSVALRPTVVATTAGIGGAAGTASMSGHGNGQTMAITVSGLPVPPADLHYEIWLAASGSDRMLPVGQLPPGGRGRYVLPAAVVTGFDRVDVREARNDAPAGSPGLSVLSGTLT